ncbi:MAG: YebC/PmpR family DNA-binding transcriptional regulator [Bacteroidota bacterium]|jgi:YebC/PmpR family DNA-binding regulatory protein
MGRIFEKRKHKMFARFAKMAKAFTKIGREIVIAVKAGGPDPANNARLRQVIANARALNMPKDRIDSAIKRANDKDTSNYEEVIYEGYAPHGVAVLVECATDNPTRTVANIRMYFNRGGGELGKSGSVGFMFDRKGMFKVNAKGMSKDEIEFELIDFGAEEYTWDDETGELIIQTSFADFGQMQKALEDRNIEVQSSSKVFVPNVSKEITQEQENEVMELVEKMEDDDDVLAVYTNIQ